MSEMIPGLPPRLRSALDEFYAVPQPDPAFVAGLAARLRVHQAGLSSPAPAPAPQRRSLMHTLRTRPALAVLAAILALLLLTGMAYAVGRLTGFIPGIGFVHDVHAVLETPVTVTREVTAAPTAAPGPTSSPAPAAEAGADATPVTVQERQGITLTVERAVAEANQLVINYTVSGLPPSLYEPERVRTLQAMPGETQQDPVIDQVRLPDGTLLKRGDGGTCSGASDSSTAWLNCRAVYRPLPAGVDRFTLEIPHLQNALPGELPEDWRIPIQLTPVVAAQAAGGIQEPHLHSQAVGGVTLRLDKVVQSQTQTAFQFGMEWEGAHQIVLHTAPITLQDAQGRYYILSGGPEGGAYTIDNPNFTTLPSLVTSPVDGSSPLTFRMDWVTISASTRGADNSAAILKFDPGKAAQVGQEWTLDQGFQAGGLELRVSAARLKAAPDGSYVLEFDIQAPPSVTRVNLMVKDAATSSPESGYDPARGVLVSRVTLPTLPTQPLELYISEVVYRVQGPWEITWQPQEVSAVFPTPTPAPTRLAPPTPTLDPGAPLLAEARALLDKAPLPTGPGWVHQTIQTERAADSGVLETGDLPEQPAQMAVDTWYRLDEQGLVRTTITVRKTLDGEFVSADVDNGVYHFTFPEARGNLGRDVYLAGLSNSINPLSTIQGYLAQGGSLSREAGAVDGKACQRYVAGLTYDPPMVLWGEPAPVREMVYSVCIDPASGAAWQSEARMTYSDGTERVKNSDRYILLEKVEVLPEEASQWLAKIVMP